MPKKTVQRFEDMSPRGRLVVHQQDDGDIIIAVYEDPSEPVPSSASVEFCTRFGGGGQSPRTWAALVSLMLAIELDNADSVQARGGE